MKRAAIAPGVYQSEPGVFWSRPTIRGRRTWRRLKAIKPKAAIHEAFQAAKPKSGKFEDLARRYLDAGCPNRRLESRHDKFIELERRNIGWLTGYFGDMNPGEIRLANLTEYRAWREGQIRRRNGGTGARMIELEWVTLSNVLNYSVSLGLMDVNLIRSGRPRLRKLADVRHCRESAPASGDEVHALARALFEDPRSEVLGWQFLFEAFTGCRTSEVLGLRMDSKNPEQPGFVSGNYLFLRRSKGGVNPFALITLELAEVLAVHRQWHAAKYPNASSFKKWTKKWTTAKN